MKIKKNITFIIISIIILISFTSCFNNTNWVYKYNNNSISSGLYLSYLLTSHGQAVQKVSEQLKSENKTLNNPNDVYKYKIDNKDVSTWIKENTETLCKEYFTVEKLFKELELSLNDDDNTKLNSTLENFWTSYGTYYEQNGVSKESTKLNLENSIKREKIFNKYYASGGLEEVPENDIKSFFTENFAKVKYVLMPLVDINNKTLNEEDKNKLKEHANGYVEKLNNGASIDDLIKEYQDIINKKKEEAGISTNNSSTSTDPNNNFVIVPKNNSSLPEKLVEETFKAELNKPILIEDSYYYFVLIRYDISNDNENFDKYKNSSLIQLKENDFNKKIEENSKSISMDKNNAAVSKYKPQNIKQNNK